MNEGAGRTVFDLCGNKNDGTLVADTHFVPGKFDSALDFDGVGDYVSIANASFAHDPWTISLWFKANSIKAQGAQPHEKMSLFTYGNVYYSLNIASADSKIHYYYYDGAVREWIANTVINTGEWYHVVVVSDPNSSEIFLNGLSDGASDSLTYQDNTCPGGACDFVIGGGYSPTTPTLHFDGQIDHVIFWNRALAGSEIALLYREPFCGFRWMSIEEYGLYLPAVPEIRALYMDLATQIWTIKHAKGLFTKL